MRKPGYLTIHLGLVCLMAISLLLGGCSASRPTDESPAATTVPEMVAPEGDEAGVAFESTLDNLAQLAPVHIRSSYLAKLGDEVAEQTSYETDVDAAGNQHTVIHSEDGDTLELYVVDGLLYFGSEGDQFVSVGEMEEDSPFAVLAAYGAEYLLAFNDLQDARKVGSEAVNGFQADKYEFDLTSAGLTGIAAGGDGAQFEYQAYAWIEPESGALVRSRVDWTVRAEEGQEAETFHSEFDATKGTVTEIQAPENVVSFDG